MISLVFSEGFELNGVETDGSGSGRLTAPMNQKKEMLQGCSFVGDKDKLREVKLEKLKQL